MCVLTKKMSWTAEHNKMLIEIENKMDGYPYCDMIDVHAANDLLKALEQRLSIDICNGEVTSFRWIARVTEDKIPKDIMERIEEVQSDITYMIKQDEEEEEESRE